MNLVTRRRVLLVPAAAVLSRPALLVAQELRAPLEKHPIPEIHAALERMYNFDFPGAHKLLDAFIAANPSHPLGYGFRASALLFSEMDRLRVLDSEFLTDDDKIQADTKLEPSARTRDAFVAAIQTTQKLARERTPRDASAMFALCMGDGMTSDYMAFIEKRRIGSLSYAKESQAYAVELQKKYPEFVDAKLTSGISEYLIGSLPFFLKWFIRFPQVEGDKKKAVANLNTVATDAYYLGPFARILLAIVHIREKRPAESIKLLEGLTRDYPENRLFKQELAKLQKKR